MFNYISVKLIYNQSSSLVALHCSIMGIRGKEEERNEGWPIRRWVKSLGYFLALSNQTIGEGNGTPLQYSCLANPMEEEPGRLQSMGSLGVGHDWVTSLSLFTFMHWRRKWQPISLGSHRVGHDWSDLAAAAENKEHRVRTVVLQADTRGSKRSEKVWEVSELSAAKLGERLPLQEASA